MFRRLRAVLGLSVIWLGVTASCASALETRTANFLFTCDGQNKQVTFNATGLGNNAGRFVTGVGIVLFENHGGLQYVLLRVAGDANRQLLTLGLADNSAISHFTDFLTVTTSGTGTIPFTIDGACNPGAGQIQGNVTIFFFSSTAFVL